nr:MAPK-interacting and spindle-stabilizing protein-like [Chlorocebus sabaeus]
MRTPQARRPEAQKVPCGCRPSGSCTRDLDHRGLWQQKVGEGAVKLQGRPEKSPERAVRWGRQPGTCRSPGASGSLSSATPSASAAGIRPRGAAPRLPPRRRGEPGGPRRPVCPSVPPSWSEAPGSCGRGGAGPAARPPPHWSQLRQPLVSGPQPGAPGRGRGRLRTARLRPLDRRTD